MKNHRKQKVTDWVSFRNEYKKLSLTALPMLLAWVILILFSYFWNGPVPTIVLSLTFFLAGFMGIIIIVRREDSRCPFYYYRYAGHRGGKYRDNFFLGFCRIYNSAGIVVKGMPTVRCVFRSKNIDTTPATFARNGWIYYFLLLDFVSALLRFSATLNLTILLINFNGKGLSIGNRTVPFAPS